MADSVVPNTLIEADTDFSDEGYADSDMESYVTSIASDVRRFVEENGRLYPSMESRHIIGTPVDEDEKERNDLQHCKFMLLLDGQLHLSPIGDNPQNVLDLGTGTGIWAIDMADKYPSASVVGVDLAPVQPGWIPPNLQFELDDIENDWTWKKDRFDLVHGRELMLAIRDWPKLLHQCLQHLKPGSYAEFAGTYPLISCDDSSLPLNTAYEETGFIWFEIGDAMGASTRVPALWKQLMEEAGFEDVQEHKFKIPTSPWPKDKRLKKVGAFELVQYRDQVAGIFLRGFIRGLKKTHVEMELIFSKARQEVQNRKMHSYIWYYQVTGRKPENWVSRI